MNSRAQPPHPAVSLRRARRCSMMVLLALAASAGWAHEAPHVHGTVKMDVALEGDKLSVALEAPLDSLLGFEHRPRTAAQRDAAAKLLAQLRAGPGVTPDPAAGCTLASTTVEADALTAGEPATRGKDTDHADLDASYEFTCARPQDLRKLDVQLFDAFKRIRRIEARFAGPQGQSARVLTPGSRTLVLGR